MHLQHRGKKIGLDSGNAELSFLSHAHSDHLHAIRSTSELIASAETIALAGLSGQGANHEGTRLIEAGHILGARQLVLEDEDVGEKIIYTGDISFKKNIFGFSAKIEQCDRLIMESTYASPEYNFRDAFEVYDEVAKWVQKNDKANILIGAYELGKAQELIKILNEYCGIAPVVIEKTDNFCEVYEAFGYKLDRLLLGTDEAESEMNRRFVAVVPMRLAKRSFAERLSDAFEKDTKIAVATGWALKFRYNADAAFALSDHADFEGLVEYAEQSCASNIEFFEGDGSKVVETARKKLVCTAKT